MNLSDIFSPVKRSFTLFVFLIGIFTSLSFWGLNQIPEIQKSMIYYSVKPELTENTQNTSLDPIGSASKIAETMAGWAKNPAFRNEIQINAGVQISNFKRKISARKQNVMNVFWTLKFYGAETENASRILNATSKVIQQRFYDLNQNSAFPFALTDFEISNTNSSIPKSWKILISLFLGLFFAFIFIYIFSNLKGKIAYFFEIENLFPNAPILKIAEHIGKHDKDIIEKFIFTFQNPVLIHTFPTSEEHFEKLPEIQKGEKISPILITQMGKTSLRELENLKAIYGENIGIILFER